MGGSEGIIRSGGDGPSPGIGLDPWPPLPLAEWEPTKQTIHRFVQIVGKVRLAKVPFRNHWWHVTLYVSPTGLTTRSIPTGDGRSFAIDFDFQRHVLIVTTSDRHKVAFDLPGHSVATFYARLMAVLAEFGIPVQIVAVPFDLQPATPFAEDTAHASYDAAAVERWWRILVSLDHVFTRFSGHFTGKTSPVHLFWHTFDLAVTRFSGRPAPERAGVDPVTREAYSHEVVSFGFWAGDANLPEPACYSYTWPDPPGLTEHPLRPAAARWGDSRGSALALLTYADLRAEPDPESALMAFLESAYQAGATAAGWDLAAFRPAHLPAHDRP